MTSSPTIQTKNSNTATDFRKRWMLCALVISLVLHGGAALVIIVAGSFSIGGKNSTHFVIQDIELSPSISSPVKTATAPPEQRLAIPSPAPTSAIGTDNPAPESIPEQPAHSSEHSEKQAEIASTPLGLGMAHGYFSSLADGRSLRDDIRGYYFEMVEKINREWWDKAGFLKEPLRQDGIFELLIQRDGTIVSVRILRGTGSKEADRLVTDMIRSISPLPSLPSTYDLSQFRAPLRIKAPSFLFRSRN